MKVKEQSLESSCNGVSRVILGDFIFFSYIRTNFISLCELSLISAKIG